MYTNILNVNIEIPIDSVRSGDYIGMMESPFVETLCETQHQVQVRSPSLETLLMHPILMNREAQT